MSSTAYRDWASRRWRPTVAGPSPAALRRAKRLLLWQAAVNAGFLLVIMTTNVVIWLLHDHHSRWSALIFLIGIVWTPLAVVSVAVTWWLMWRLHKAETGGDSR